MSTIPLAKGYDEKRLSFPVHVSRKFDGVPVRIDITETGWTTQTRQGKPMPSIEKLVTEFCAALCKYVDGRPIILIGEVIQWANPDADFKETSGIIRRQYDQSDQLGIMLFDCEMEPGTEYSERLRWMEETIGGPMHSRLLHTRVSVVNTYTVYTVGELCSLQEGFEYSHPEWEGLVARNHDDMFTPGKRSWGYQKLLKEPTIDLFVVGVTEALDKNKRPKNMVGGLVVSYKGVLSKVGSGKMQHTERTNLFVDTYRNEASSVNTGLPGAPNAVWYEFPVPLLAQIKHKGDDSYDALRQPTFQHWRDDKCTPDA